MNGTDWLEDLEAADDSADGWQCLADPTDEHNRSTIYDVAKLFWYLTSQAPTPLPPEDLADLYVDMCPRGWAQTDARSDDDELPYSRLIFSAAEHGIVGPVSSAGSAYIHH